jgi:mono/diheme cytochrome c family protein
MTASRLVAAACAALWSGASALAAPPARTPELVERGKAAYAKNCVVCHGAKGEGDGAAAKSLDPKPRNLVTSPMPGGAPAVFEVLATGKKGTGMIAYKHLPEQDRWAIAYFVEGLAGTPAK